MSGTKSKKPAAGVAWEPPPRADKPDWSAVAQTLRDNPMRWLKVFVHGRESWANTIMRGHVRVLHPDLGFEAKTSENARTSPRTCTLHMRWNPDKADPLAELLAGKK